MIKGRSQVFLLSLLALVACGESPMEPPVDLGLWGSVSFEYSGTRQGSFRAERIWDGSSQPLPYAVAAPVSYEGVDEVVRFLTGDEDLISFSLTIFHLPAAGQATMTHTVNSTTCNQDHPCARSFFVAGFAENGTPRIVIMTEGVVEVEERSATRIKGRFSIAGVSFAQEAVGDFNASTFIDGRFDLPITLLGCNDAACDS
jgi:hypothetical protein